MEKRTGILQKICKFFEERKQKNQAVLALRKQNLAFDAHIRQIKRKNMLVWGLTFGLFVLFLAFWELSVRQAWVSGFIFSSPSRIFATLKSLKSSGQLWSNIWVTVQECIFGFLIATVLGTVVAIALWWSETARRVVEPYLVVLNSLPKIALGPIIIIWMGAGMGAIVAMAVLICIIITIISMLHSFASCPPEKVLLLRSLGANKAQIFGKLIFMRSIPDLISVLKINVGLSWVGTIMGEYIVSKAGLGYLIIYGGTVFQFDLVMASTVLLCFLAAIMYLSVALAERIIKRSRI